MQKLLLALIIFVSTCAIGQQLDLPANCHDNGDSIVCCTDDGEICIYCMKSPRPSDDGPRCGLLSLSQTSQWKFQDKLLFAAIKESRADMVESADTLALKAKANKVASGFKSQYPHQR